MTKLPALVDDLAEHDVRGRPTVELVARMIREAGLIQTTKRGRGAADMTAADAAALLIGLCVSEAPKDAPAAVKTFWDLGSFDDPDMDIRGYDDYPPLLAPVFEVETFGQAMGVLIASAEEIRAFLDKRTVDPNSFPGRGKQHRDWSEADAGFSLNVFFYLPRPMAEITLLWESRAPGRRLHRARRVFHQGAGHRAADHARRERRLDRSVQVRLDFWTFLRINGLLRTPLVPEWVR
jgi:hypothetical protein